MNDVSIQEKPARQTAPPTLDGKVVLITGAAQGLGAAIARRLAEEGAVCLVTDVRTQNLTQLTDELQALGRKAHGYALDVSDAENVSDVIQRIIAEHGRLDVVINNAGIDFTKPIEELEVAEWDRVMKVNLYGPFLVSKAALPHLRENGTGHIINIVSTAAKRAWPNASAYHASKWGLLGFSHALHVEARQQGVKVTAIIAGGMQTPFILERFPDTDPNVLQDPRNVADTVRYILNQPAETVIAEVTVIPMRETSWP